MIKLNEKPAREMIGYAIPTDSPDIPMVLYAGGTTVVMVHASVLFQAIQQSARYKEMKSLGLGGRPIEFRSVANELESPKDAWITSTSPEMKLHNENGALLVSL